MVSTPRGRSAVQGTITRGTTHPNRLRRVDSWLLSHHRGLLRQHPHPHSPQGWAPVVADVGFGAQPVTTEELWSRCYQLQPLVQVVGFDVDPSRVAAAQALVGARATYCVGGFEVPLPGNTPACLIRAANVLRQYDEAEVPAAWELLRSRLCSSGVALDITCDEVGRLATWVALRADGPETFTIAASFRTLQQPSDVAPRLVKSLIHHNVPGTAIHRLLSAFDDAWATHSYLRVHGSRQRWMASVRALKDKGWPVVDRPSRWRHGEMTVAWSAVDPWR